MGKKIILLIEDEKNISEVIKSYLENDGYEIIIASDGYSGIKVYQNKSVDLIILDLMLPDIDGFNVCKFIRNLSDIPIIMLTARAKEDDIICGLNTGADDYITKPFSPGQLVARVNAILRRTSGDSKDNDIIEFRDLKIRIDLKSHEFFLNESNVLLTPAEFNIISLFLKHPNKIFTREELISHVFGDDNCSYDRTIDAHIKNLRRKIEKDTRNPSIVLTVHGLGYKFCGSVKI